MTKIREYRIFHRDNYGINAGKWVTFKIDQSFKTLKEARVELKRLKEAEARLQKTGRSVDHVGAIGIECEYPAGYKTEYKICKREITPWEEVR